MRRAHSSGWAKAAIVAVNALPLILIAARLADAGELLVFYLGEMIAVTLIGLVRILIAVRTVLSERFEAAAFLLGTAVLVIGFCAMVVFAGLGIEPRIGAAMGAALALSAAYELSRVLRERKGRDRRSRKAEFVFAPLFLRLLATMMLVGLCSFVLYNAGLIAILPYVLVTAKTLIEIAADAHAARSDG